MIRFNNNSLRHRTANVWTTMRPKCRKYSKYFPPQCDNLRPKWKDYSNCQPLRNTSIHFTRSQVLWMPRPAGDNIVVPEKIFYIAGYDALLRSAKSVIYGDQEYTTPFKSIDKVKELSYIPVTAVRTYIESVHYLETLNFEYIESGTTVSDAIFICDFLITASMIFSLRRSKELTRFSFSEYKSGKITTSTSDMSFFKVYCHKTWKTSDAIIAYRAEKRLFGRNICEILTAPYYIRFRSQRLYIYSRHSRATELTFRQGQKKYQ